MLVRGKKYRVLYDSLGYFEDGDIVRTIGNNPTIDYCVLDSEYVDNYTVIDYQREGIKYYPMNIRELEEI